MPTTFAVLSESDFFAGEEREEVLALEEALACKVGVFLTALVPRVLIPEVAAFVIAEDEVEDDAFVSRMMNCGLRTKLTKPGNVSLDFTILNSQD